MILGIDHAQVTIPENTEAAAREFYCDFLGLPEIEKPLNRRRNGGFWLQVGALQLHVGVENGVDRAKTKAHVAYQVDDLDFWREKFQNRGIEHGRAIFFQWARVLAVASLFKFEWNFCL